METITGSKYAKYVCCVNESCAAFSDVLKLADCYEAGGKIKKRPVKRVEPSETVN